MRQFVLSLSAWFALVGLGRCALAQQEPPATGQEEPPDEKALQPTPITAPTETPAKPGPGGAKGSWSDIIVVPRKAVLKTSRLELAPFWGVSLNDPLIQHFGFGGQLNFFFSDVFGVGLEGIYYQHKISDRGNLIGLQYHRVPTINEMHWAAALNFTYVPIYGKFAFFNHGIVHWEATVIGGVGVTNTEIIPRDPSDATFTNYDITPNLGLGGRLFISDWLTLWFNVRDYVFPDKFEAANRMGGTGEEAKSRADTQIVNNVLLALGASFFIPTKFSYHTAK